MHHSAGSPVQLWPVTCARDMARYHILTARTRRTTGQGPDLVRRRSRGTLSECLSQSQRVIPVLLGHGTALRTDSQRTSVAARCMMRQRRPVQDRLQDAHIVLDLEPADPGGSRANGQASGIKTVHKTRNEACNWPRSAVATFLHACDQRKL